MRTRWTGIGIRLKKHKQGGTLVLVAVFLVALFGFAAFSLDVGNVYREQRKENTATDAAALAGVLSLTNQDVSDAIANASAIAQANGVTATEISNGRDGAIVVGTWTNNAFTATADNNGNYNAIRVSAKRNVPLNFAQLVGLTEMNPAVSSVAMIGSLNSVAGGTGLLVPVAISSNQFASLQVGSVFDTTKSSGNEGKIDFCGQNESSGSQFPQDMVSGVGCTVSIGTVAKSGPGNGGFDTGFSDRLTSNPIAVIAVIDAFGSGKKDVTVVDFILVQLLGTNGTWNGQIKLLGTVVGQGGGIGGTEQQPYAFSRALVQ